MWPLGLLLHWGPNSADCSAEPRFFSRRHRHMQLGAGLWRGSNHATTSKKKGVSTGTSLNIIEQLSKKYYYDDDKNLFILLSRKLTYPTWGKGKSSSKWTFQGICSFPGGYYDDDKNLFILTIKPSKRSSFALLANPFGWTAPTGFVFQHTGWKLEQKGDAYLTEPPKTNMEPENTLLEKEKQLQTTNCWVPC